MATSLPFARITAVLFLSLLLSYLTSGELANDYGSRLFLDGNGNWVSTRRERMRQGSSRAGTVGNTHSRRRPLNQLLLLAALLLERILPGKIDTSPLRGSTFPRRKTALL